MTHEEIVSLADITAAGQLLEGVAVTTPLDRSRSLSQLAGMDVYVKAENLQRTGSFKIRGAYNRIARLTESEREAGVTAASAGNHAQGVALAASLSNTKATVFMPQAATLPKVEGTKRYGAEVVLTGSDIGAALSAAIRFAEESGAVLVHPYDHPHVIAGQGTCGLEICEQMGDIGTVVVPVGGGGLISGIAAAIKTCKPEARVVGVQAEGAAAWPPSLAAGRPISLEYLSTIADGIAANSPGRFTFAHVKRFVDEIVTVSDDAIAQALLLAVERMKLVLEPAGAAGVAAVMQGIGGLRPPVITVVSGGNVDPLLLLGVIRYGLGAEGRYLAFHTHIADRPGELHRLLGLVAKLGANVVGVEHHREGARLPMGEVDVLLRIETRGPAHIDQLVATLGDAGYQVMRT